MNPAPDALTQYLARRYAIHNFPDQDPVFKTIYKVVKTSSFPLIPEKQLPQKEIKQVLVSTTGRKVSDLFYLRPDYFPRNKILSRLRRIFWTDVEEHLEFALDQKFRASVWGDACDLFSAIQLSLNPLEKILYEQYKSVMNLGAPECTLWEAIQYCLADYLLFSLEGGVLLTAARNQLPVGHNQDPTEHGQNIAARLAELCRVLTWCFPLGEDKHDPGTWFIFCASPI